MAAGLAMVVTVVWPVLAEWVLAVSVVVMAGLVGVGVMPTTPGQAVSASVAPEAMEVTRQRPSGVATAVTVVTGATPRHWSCPPMRLGGAEGFGGAGVGDGSYGADGANGTP